MVLPTGNEELFRKAINQGHSAAWEQRWPQAVEHYTRALKEFPDNPPALNSLALAHLELGHLDQALELYQRAARLSPEDPLPVEKIAQIHQQLGQVQEGVEFSMRAADLYLNMRDADKAINNWTRVIRLDPESVEAHERLARLYERLGRTQQAITEQIAAASLLQHAGRLEEAQIAGEHALSLDPKNKEAQNAVEMLKAFESLPKPVRKAGPTGPLRAVKDKARDADKTAMKAFEESPDPIEEARQKALQTLAAMLFDLTPSEAEMKQQTGTLRSIARVVADGLLARGFDERKIVRHLSNAIESQSREEKQKAAEELQLAVQAGLDHPAAHFNLGILLAGAEQFEEAQHSFQRAVKHADYGLAARLLMAGHLLAEGRDHEAAVEYLRALKAADAAVVPEDQAEALRQQYEPLVEAASQDEDAKEIERLCENIRHLLLRPSWRMGVKEARSQLPENTNGTGPLPLAEILTQANSGRLVDSMARINHLAREGHLRAAMEETFTTLEFAPNYLPLHINMGELMLMQEHPQEASDKFATVARVYSARGESDRATQMYQRIVDISPLDTRARAHLIDQVTAQGEIEEAISQYLEMADVYYRLAQLDQARATYEKALRISQSAEADSTWTAQILHQIADIDLQRLDWRKALRVYEQLRSLVPSDESARNHLIELNLRLGQTAKANGELDNYLSYLNSLSRDEEAANFLRNVVEEYPHFSLAHRRLAEHYQQLGQNEEAIEEWNKVGELQVQAGDREGAKMAVRAILSLNPPNAERYQKFLQRLSK